MAQWGQHPGRSSTGAESRVTWGTFTRTYEQLKKLTQKPPDPEQEKRDRERVRRKEALDRLKASGDWWVVEAIYAEAYTEYLGLVAREAEPPAAFRVLLDIYQRFDMHQWSGEQALRRLTARRMAAHQRLMNMPVPPSATADGLEE